MSNFELLGIYETLQQHYSPVEVAAIFRDLLHDNYYTSEEVREIAVELLRED